MAKTLLEFAAECASFSPVYKATQVVALKAAAEVTQESILDSAARQRWPRKSHGMGPLGVTTRILGDAAEVRGRGGATYAFEYGAKPHVILPRKKKMLRTPYGPRAFVQSPGFKGRHFWSTGVLTAEPKVVKVIEAGVVNAMRRTFT